MIFVTVGTTQFPFLRMRDVVLRLIEQNKKNEMILFQHGEMPGVVHSLVMNFSSLSYSKMKIYMRKARIIICHGGPATIFQAIAAGKKPYVEPRREALGEHVDDHQVYFTNYAYQQNLIHLIKQDYIKTIFRASPENIEHKELKVSKQLIMYLHSVTKNV